LILKSPSSAHRPFFCNINSAEQSISVIEDSGPDVSGKVSDIIAPHRCCAGYEANYNKLHDTRPNAEDPDKNREKKTTADVT
jgi:hypothetical protein